MAAAARAVPKRSDPGRGRGCGARTRVRGTVPRAVVVGAPRRTGPAASCPLPAARGAEPPARVTGSRRKEVTAGWPGDFRDPELQGAAPSARAARPGPLRSPLPLFPVSPPEQKAGVSPKRGLPREELGNCRTPGGFGVTAAAAPRRKPGCTREVTGPRSHRSAGLGTPLPGMATNRLPSPLEESGRRQRVPQLPQCTPQAWGKGGTAGLGGCQSPPGPRGRAGTCRRSSAFWTRCASRVGCLLRGRRGDQVCAAPGERSCTGRDGTLCPPGWEPAASWARSWGGKLPYCRTLSSQPGADRWLQKEGLVRCDFCGLESPCPRLRARILRLFGGRVEVQLLVSNSGYPWDTSLPWIFFFSLTLGKANQGEVRRGVAFRPGDDLEGSFRGAGKVRPSTSAVVTQGHAYRNVRLFP